MVKNVLIFLVPLLVLAATVQSSPVDIFVGSDSCEGRCNRTGTDPNFDCQCNIPCLNFGDCCNDYTTLCLGGGGTGSCKGKCDAVGTDPNAPCQCNKPCVSFGDCCPDYEEVCDVVAPTTTSTTPRPGGVSDAELAALSEELLTLESENNGNSYVTIDLQSETSQGSSQDKAPNPLLTVDPQAYTRNTIALLVKLHDNYIADTGKAEVVTPEEVAEENAFLDAVFATPLFQKTKAFLIQKGFLTESNFRETFHQIWFGLYSRGAVGSSGFEHVFLGELKSGVSGFHNWVFFSKEEAAGRLNYNGWLDYGTFGSKGSLVSHNFVWQSNLKPISSMFVGTSPELELSVFTVCWYARPNSRCTIQFNGTKFYIQTYDITYSGKKFVASSYADVN